MRVHSQPITSTIFSMYLRVSIICKQKKKESYEYIVRGLEKNKDKLQSGLNENL